MPAAGANLDSGGGFEEDEDLALTFAEKAAKESLPAAQLAIAMRYYGQVGVALFARTQKKCNLFG